MATGTARQGKNSSSDKSTHSAGRMSEGKGWRGRIVWRGKRKDDRSWGNKTSQEGRDLDCKEETGQKVEDEFHLVDLLHIGADMARQPCSGAGGIFPGLAPEPTTRSEQARHLLPSHVVTMTIELFCPNSIRGADGRPAPFPQAPAGQSERPSCSPQLHLAVDVSSQAFARLHRPSQDAGGVDSHVSTGHNPHTFASSRTTSLIASPWAD
eukprot:761230-Hanusia_phi.AAC.6